MTGAGPTQILRCAQDDMSEEFYNGIAIFPEYATTFAQYASRWIAQCPFHDQIRSPYLE